MARTSNEQIMAALAALAAEVAALKAAPAKAAPAKAKAAEPTGFVTFLRERAGEKVACEIHSAKRCNRTFSPASSGRENHVARLED